MTEQEINEQLDALWQNCQEMEDEEFFKQKNDLEYQLWILQMEKMDNLEDLG